MANKGRLCQDVGKHSETPTKHFTFPESRVDQRSNRHYHWTPVSALRLTVTRPCSVTHSVSVCVCPIILPAAGIQGIK